MLISASIFPHRHRIERHAKLILWALERAFRTMQARAGVNFGPRGRWPGKAAPLARHCDAERAIDWLACGAFESMRFYGKISRARRRDPIS